MKKKNIFCLLLLVTFLFHFLVNYKILHLSQIPWMYDQGVRIHDSIYFFHEFLSAPHINIPGLIKAAFSLSDFQCHPRLFDVLGSISFKILDLFNALDISVMILVINSFYLFISLISVYKIGSIIYDRNTGLLSAVLLSFFPLVFGHSRLAMLDYPLMCTVSLAIYFLLSTKHFQSVYYSIITGLACGLAQLTKESAILFITPVFLCYFLQSFKLEYKKKIVINALLMAFLFVVISGSVYLRNENIQALKVYYDKINYIQHHPNLFYYANDFINGIGPFILYLSLPLLLNFLVRLKKREKILFIWFFVPLILFSLSPNKSMRFLLPVFPAFSLIVAGEITNRSWPRLFRLGYTVIILVCALFQYYLLNTGLLKLPGYEDILERGIFSVQKDRYATARAAIINTFVQEHNQAIKENRVEGSTVACLFNIGEIFWPLRIYMILHRLPFMIYCVMEFDPVDMLNIEYRKVDWGEKILTVEYILDKSGKRNIAPYVRFVGDAQRRVFNKNINSFEVIGSFPMDDGTNLFIYKRKKGHDK